MTGSHEKHTLYEFNLSILVCLESFLNDQCTPFNLIQATLHQNNELFFTWVPNSGSFVLKSVLFMLKEGGIICKIWRFIYVISYMPTVLIFYERDIPESHRNTFIVKTQLLFVNLRDNFISNNFSGMKMDFCFRKKSEQLALMVMYIKV